MNQTSLLAVVVPDLPAQLMPEILERVEVEFTLTPPREYFRLETMDWAMASVSRKAVLSFSTRFFSGVLSISTLPL